MKIDEVKALFKNASVKELSDLIDKFADDERAGVIKIKENAKKQIEERKYEEELRQRGYTSITKMVYAFKGKEVKFETY